VKKALASAWIGAVVAHTCLRRPALRDVALDFHAQWEQGVYATHLRRVVQYAREAAQFNPQPFWTARATTPLKEDGELDESRLWREPEVVRAHTRLRESQTIELRSSPAVRLEPRGAIRGHEVVLEPALIAPAVRGGLRFLSGVNLPALVDIVGRYRQIPDLFDAYCRANPPVPLPNLLGALAVLVAKGLLVERE